jgi:hypothetical protein
VKRKREDEGEDILIPFVALRHPVILIFIQRSAGLFYMLSPS